MQIEERLPIDFFTNPKWVSSASSSEPGSESRRFSSLKDSSGDFPEPCAARCDSPATPCNPANPQPKPKLLNEVRGILRKKHYSLRTEESYTGWIRRYILFHDKQHPASLGAVHVETFLSHLATAHNVAAATQNQALNSIVFLYREVLRLEIGDFSKFTRAKLPRKLPLVLTVAETRRLLDAMEGVPQLMARLCYGAGLRLMDTVRLRVKDLNFEQQQIVVRNGKGGKYAKVVVMQR